MWRRLLRVTGFPAALVAATALALPTVASVPRARVQDYAGEMQLYLGGGDNSDLADLIARAAAIRALAAQCNGMDCPQLLTCEEAQRLEADLYNLRALLEEQNRWLRQANDDAFQHFRNLSGQEHQTSVQMVRAIHSLGLQRFFHDLSKSIMDVTDLASAYKTLSQGDLAKNWGKLVENVDKFEKAVGKIEKTLDLADEGTGAQIYGQAYNEGWKAVKKEGAAATGVSPETQGLIRDGAGQLLKAVNKYRDALAKADGDRLTAAGRAFWNSGLKNPDGPAKFLNETEALRADVLKWVQKLGVEVSARLIAETEAYLADLNKNLGAEGVARGAAFLELQKFQNRRFQSEDALAAVDAALSEFAGCMALATCPRGTRVPLLSTLPDFVRTLPDGTRVGSWGWALQRIHAEIEALRAGLTPPGVKDLCGPKDDRALLMLGDPFAGQFLRLATDGTVWCTFRDGNPTPAGDDPRDGPPDGDDPRDAPPAGDDPRDAAPPPGGDDPRDKGPCDRIVELRIELTRLARIRSDGGASQAERDRARDEMHWNEQELLALVPLCPRNGGDPRDGPDAGDDPRDAPGPIGDDPRDKGPCEELAELRAARDKLLKDAASTALTDADRAAARLRTALVDSEILQLEKRCPRDDDPRDATAGGGDPRDGGGEDDPRDRPVDIFVKASTASLERGAQVRDEIAGQQIKLFPASTRDVALPGPGVAKPQADAGLGPIQGVTDRNGGLRLKATPRELGLISTPFLRVLDRNGGAAFEVNVDTTRQDSKNLIVPGASTKDATAGLSVDLRRYLTSAVQIGENAYLTFSFSKIEEEKLGKLLAGYDPKLIETNWCRTKEPRAPQSEADGARIPPGEELPGARISLAGAGR